MAALKMAFHDQTARRIVEVYDNDGQLVAAIYPDDAVNGIKIVSTHIEACALDDGKDKLPPIPAINVQFRRRI